MSSVNVRCYLFAFGFKSTITKLYFEPCYRLNLFVLCEKNRYCMTKGLVNPDVVEREEKKAVYKYGGEQTDETRPCVSLSRHLILRNVSFAHCSMGTPSSTTLCTYRHLNWGNGDLEGLASSGLWRCAESSVAFEERGEDAKCLLRGHLQLFFCCFFK